MNALETLAEQMGHEDAIAGFPQSECLFSEPIFISAWNRGWESSKQNEEKLS